VKQSRSTQEKWLQSGPEIKTYNLLEVMRTVSNGSFILGSFPDIVNGRDCTESDDHIKLSGKAAVAFFYVPFRNISRGPEEIQE
jgi:hypothetical protein